MEYSILEYFADNKNFYYISKLDFVFIFVQKSTFALVTSSLIVQDPLRGFSWCAQILKNIDGSHDLLIYNFTLYIPFPFFTYNKMSSTGSEVPLKKPI